MKAMHLLLLVAVVGFSAVFFVAFQGREDLQKTGESQIQDLKNAQWDFLEGKIEGWYQQSKEHIDTIAANIRKEIVSAYAVNGRNLEYDLTHPNQTVNPVISIIGKNIEGVHLNNVISDADDAWAANRTAIISDFSKDCAAAGRTRSFRVEESGHFSPELARQNIHRILNEDTSTWLGWEYLHPTNKLFTVPYFAKDELRDLFMRYGIDALASFEFSTPAYIDFNKDLAGVPLVNDHGEQVPNGQLIIVQGFNLVRQLYSVRNGMVEYREIGDSIRLAKERADKLLLLDNFEVIVSFLAIFALWGTSVRIESKHQEGECDE